MTITPASIQDIPTLVKLLNSAYRGDVSKNGWTTEADLLEGELRTDESTVKELMQKPGALFLKYSTGGDAIKGCVFLHKKENKFYLGMLSVSPWIQAKGIGKELMSAAEAFAHEQNCSGIFMKVISVRHELIAWYERQGYYKTGETKPFPDDVRFGIPKQPLEFVVLEKLL